MSTNLSCGIIGLPNVGKSTLFVALTKKQVPSENYPFCTIDPNIGIVEVKDPRLIHLAKQQKSKKIIYATVSFVDIAGLVKGASQGEGLGNQFLANIRNSDIIVQVVRCFEDDEISHVSGGIDPLDDIEIINIELTLSDLQMAENIKKKLEKQGRGKKEQELSLPLIDKIISHLNEEKPIRSLNISKEEKNLLKTFSFLTAKKILYIANIAEKDLNNKDNKNLQRLESFAQKENSPLIPLCCKLEQELAQLEEKEAVDFLHSLGLKKSSLDKLIKQAFHMLELITFITTGEIETKAWTIKKGTTAVEAAGKIHTDIQKGFIRAEIVSFSDMIKYNGRVGAREKGKARSEGKDYIIQDGDVILFFHN